MSTPEYMLVCRLCVLKNSSFANIFNVTGKVEVRIADVINELLQLNVYPGDGLPDRICCDCLNELARFKRFKNISHEAKSTLTSLIKGGGTSTPKPSTSKENNQIELVDLADNDDDSVAETIDPPSPKPELPCVELEQSEAEHFRMDDSSITEVNSYQRKEAEDEVGGMAIEKDPLESEPASDSDHTSILDDDMEADIVELEEEDTCLVDDPLANHCSRTLGYNWKSIESERKAEMVRDAMDYLSNEPKNVELSENIGPQNGSEEKYTCKVCSKEFPDNLELNIHIDKGDCGDYKCCNCETTVSSSRELRKHVTYCEKSKLYACGICDKTFSDELSLKVHMRSHQSQQHEDKHECQKCKRTFKNKRNLKGHEKRCKFSGVKREYLGHYICGVCKEGFKSYILFKKHFDAHMNIQKEALCGFCDGSYSTAIDLRKHVGNCHGTLECDICAKKFLENYLLNRHYLSHKLERPYACTMCEKTYKTRYSLNVHIGSAH